MSSVNKVIIVGRLGQDPEVKQFQNGGSITNVSIATSERWTDKQTGELKEQTEWHRVSFQNRGNYRLGDTAAQYLRKGSLVYVEGSLHTRKWTDQQGIERYTTEVKASQLNILSSHSQNNQNHGNQDYNHTGFGQGGFDNNGYHRGQQGGFGQGGHQNNQFGNPQNYNQNANYPQNQQWQNQNPAFNGNQQYQNNNPVQGFTQSPPINQSGSAQQAPTNNNQFVAPQSPPKTAPKAVVTPPTTNSPVDDDMPF